MKKTPSPAKILQIAFRRKQIARPGYSRRALARDLGLSAVFVTHMLQGKKTPPLKRLKSISHVLELDVEERAALFTGSVLKREAASLLPSLSIKRSAKARKNTTVTSGSSFLAQWWNVAVLEGLGLEEPWNDPSLLRERLKLTTLQLNQALHTLHESGLVETRDGQLKKRDSHTYLPTGRSKKEMRELHEQMIIKAQNELITRTSEIDFHRRLITGFTFTCNPDRIEPMKTKILKFLDGISRDAGIGPCREVYQCNVQFFPLTKAAVPSVGDA